MLFIKREQIRRKSSDGFFFWAIYYITIFESVYYTQVWQNDI